MNELKDKVYELEGLLELQALRPEKSEELRHLIDGRIRDINALWKAANAGRQDEEAVPCAESGAETAAVETPGEPETAIYSVPEEDDDMDVTMTDIKPAVTIDEELTREFLTDDPGVQAEPASRAVPALCLNDRYRFIRVIAGGDRRLFDEMLRAVAALPDYEAARDYVLSQCHADPDDPEVLDFLEILQQYYE